MSKTKKSFIKTGQQRQLLTCACTHKLKKLKKKNKVKQAKLH